MENFLLSSELLRKSILLWLFLTLEIESFHIHLVIMTYVDNISEYFLGTVKDKPKLVNFQITCNQNKRYWRTRNFAYVTRLLYIIF